MKTKSNCQWIHVIFIEAHYNSYNKKESTGKNHVLNVHLRGVDGLDMTSKLWCAENEDGEISSNIVFTQIWLAKYSPKLLVSYTKALKEKNNKLKDEIYEKIRDKNKELGIRLTNDKDAFIKHVNENFEGFQFRLYWQPQGLNSFGKKIDGKPASSLISSIPIGNNNKLDTVEDRSLPSFIESYRRGSIEDRTEESLESLSEFDDVFDFEDENENESEPKAEAGNGKEKTEDKTNIDSFNSSEDENLSLNF